MTVGEMLVRMDGPELVSWQAYENLCGPLPDRRADYLTAQVVAAVKNGYLKQPTSVAKEVIQFEQPEPPKAEEAAAPEPEWKKNKALFLAWAREDAKAGKPRRKSKPRKPPKP